MKTVLILGSNPSLKRQHKNSTLDRLATWAAKLAIEYDFDNVISYHVGKERIEHVDTARVKRIASKYSKIFTLGHFAHSVLNVLGISHYALPHPSPRNRQFNEPEFEAQTLSKIVHSGFLRNYN